MSVAVSKLIRQIRETLATDSNHAPVESLAGEYARLCEEANQRLDSCAAMLEKGSEYQALQLAEAEPELLDLIAALSFAEAPEWLAFCAANQLPAPTKFDPRAVQALDGLYAKGISANHPLYKDYRAAVTSRNDGKAIQIIRSIVRLNPEDANARAELSRIENKLFQLKLQELRTALSEGAEPDTVSILAELERLATPTRLAETPEYAHASEVRREVDRREAIVIAERLVESLTEERQAGAWRMVGDILARLRALQAEHHFQLSPTLAQQCEESQHYFDAQRAAAHETARFEQALGTVGGLAESFDTRLLTRSTLTFSEAETLHAEFNRRWKELEKFQRPVPEHFVQRARTSATALSAELDRLQRQRRLKIVAASALAVCLIVGAAWFTICAMQAQDYTAQLAKLREAGQVEAAEKMISDVRHEHASLAAKPQLAARLNEVDHWTHDERAKLANVESRLSGLETATGSEISASDPMTLATNLESTRQLIETIASGLRSAPSGRLLVVRNRFEAYLSTLHEKLAAEADEELTKLENLAGAKLGYDQSKETITQALGTIEPSLKSLETRVKPAVAALALPSAQQTRVTALRKRVDLFQEEIAALANVHEGLLEATTLDAYLQALGGYKVSRLAQTAEVSGARKMLAAFPPSDDLLASLLLPNDPVGWAAAKADVTGELLAPDAVLPAEIGRLVMLRDDNYLNDIWDVTFIDFHRKNARRDLYSRGDLKKEGPSLLGDGTQSTRWTGAIYDPSSKTDVPAFAPTTFTATRSPYGISGDGEVSDTHLSATSDCLLRAELNRMTDAAGAQFERPLLRVFNELVWDKSANVVFKAYLMQQLAAVLWIRPYAWGLEYCASLRDDLAELDRLCEGAALRSQDWLLERKKSQLGPKLTPFFVGLQNRDYLADARTHREVVRRALKAGLQFGGFIDESGQAHLLGEAGSSKLLWALTEDGQKLTRYAPSETKQAKSQTVGFSPILFVPLDRTALLTEIGSRVPRHAGAVEKLPAVPWLEAP